MFVDASALVAILASEAGSEELVSRFNRANARFVSAISIWEATRGLHRSHEMSLERAEQLVRDLIQVGRTVIVPIDDEIGREALRASRLYGRGQHKASLNLGDCFAYACARSLGIPLLFKGDDFAMTDIEAA